MRSMWGYLFKENISMNLNLTEIRVNKCEYRNEITSYAKLNLNVNMTNQIRLPKKLEADSVGAVITKIMVGSPLEPFYLFIEQVSHYKDSNPEQGFVQDSEELMSMYKTICIPIAIDKAEETIQNLCKTYHIPEIKIQKKA